MKKEEVFIDDWSRWLLGNLPWSFSFEALIRIVFLFVLLMVCMRLFGKKMASRLSNKELVALVSFAAAIGVPIVSPERGIIPPLIIGAVVLLVDRFISRRSIRHQRFEETVQGNIDILVKDGVMQMKEMKYTGVTRERLYAQLRSKQVRHLGLVKRLYMEANGQFTLIQYHQPKEGLSLIPEWHTSMIQKQPKSHRLVCSNCGNLKKESPVCDSCEEEAWVSAVTG